ncbi:hypothetical protein PYCC9005_001054 [Savitreella phatthalungensis]
MRITLEYLSVTHANHEVRMYRPYALRIAGSVLPTIAWQVVTLAVWALFICALDRVEAIPFQLSISPILISTLGFIVSLSLSFRTTTAYQRWWEARVLWDRLTSTSRNLARLIWVCLPEKEGSSRDVLMKKSAINLIAVFVVALKNHLRDERNDIAPDLNHNRPKSSPSRLRRAPTYQPNAVDEAGQLRFTWFLHHSSDDACIPTLRAHLLPVEAAFHLASYCEFARSNNPGMPNFIPQNFTLCLNAMNDVVSACERIRRTPTPIAYNIIMSQIVWIFCLSLPFQLCGVLSWASVPLSVVAGAFLFSLLAIGTEIEDPFGQDANDLDLERYCDVIRSELDILTSIPPPDAQEWAVRNRSNRPLAGLTDKTFAELEVLPIGEVRRLLSRKAQVTGFAPFMDEEAVRQSYGGP